MNLINLEAEGIEKRRIALIVKIRALDAIQSLSNQTRGFSFFIGLHLSKFSEFTYYTQNQSHICNGVH